MNQSSYRRQIMANLVIGAMALVLCACGERGIVTREWSEEVELEDGTILIAKRHVVFRKSSAWGGDSPTIEERVSEVEFSGAAAGNAIPKWSAPLVPILTYSDATNGQWVIVATTRMCGTWLQMGAPPSFYWEYRTSNGKWVEVPLTRMSLGRATNLAFGYPYDMTTGFYPLEVKRRLWAEIPSGDPAKTIVEGFKHNCPIKQIHMNEGTK